MLPLLPVAAALAVVVAVRPDLLTAGAGSWRAWLAAGGVVLAASVTRLVVRRWSPAWAPWASSAVVLALLGVLLLPSFDERTVNEAFPPVDTSAVTTTPTAVTASPAPAATATVTPKVTVAKRLVSGQFQGINHSASGRASWYDVAGDSVVRFENVSFQGTPDPVVYLVPRGARSVAGGIRLGALKGEHGSFSYPNLTDDASKGWTVLVWCVRYDTGIAAADLT